MRRNNFVQLNLIATEFRLKNQLYHWQFMPKHFYGNKILNNYFNDINHLNSPD